jgi:hypothetical protein
MYAHAITQARISQLSAAVDFQILLDITHSKQQGSSEVSRGCTYLLHITITGDATAIQPLKTALQNDTAFDNAQGGSNLTSAFDLANQTFVRGDALKV